MKRKLAVEDDSKCVRLNVCIEAERKAKEGGK